MGRRGGAGWLPRSLFRVTVLAATVLLGGVALAPALGDGGVGLGGWSRLLNLFAHDPVVRRTALAGAIGLYVTAGVFFRMPPKPRNGSPRPPRLPPPPGNVVGA